MYNINIDFNNADGRIKPMHAVNNGPVKKRSADQQITNMQWFIDAGIPYVRNHDASFCATYGGEHTVDVHAIFPNFDADENDPASYDFPCTDEYLRVIAESGAKTFYRLGSKIEHGVKKYGTNVPKDFHKWARICEHIIRHYIEGWADGFHYDIEYWEIWNEPECTSADGGKLNWQGTFDEFVDMFLTALEHLKKCFPHLKIGGPAFVGYNEALVSKLLTAVAERGLELDFCSWHKYTENPDKMVRDCYRFRELFDKHGFEKTESILDEWNYVKGWAGEDWIYSLRTEKNMKGAAFIASCMLACQYAPLDMLMYYDARPCGMNGLFSTDIVSDRLKGYYTLLMFNSLYKLGECVRVDTGIDGVYAVAAKNGEKSAIMLSYYKDEGGESISLKLLISNLVSESKKMKLYVLDENRDMELADEKTLDSTDGEINFEMGMNSVILLEF